MFEGKANGYGRNIFDDGDFYEGYWKDGKRHGTGRDTFKDGTFEEGQFIQDEFQE